MTAFWLLVALVFGFTLGMAFSQNHIAGCQARCAAGGMVCSPALRDGKDYCVFIDPRR